MQTSRSPESAKKPSPTATATGTEACLATALSSSSLNTAACQALASQVDWRRTNRLFTLLCTAIQGPLKVSPWEHASIVANDPISTDLSAAVQESLREDFSAPECIKSKQETVKRGNPVPGPKFGRSPPLRTSAPLASDGNQRHGLAQQKEAGFGVVAPRHGDDSSPSQSTTSDTLVCRPQVGQLSTTILTDQSESCRGLPVAIGISSSSSVRTDAASEAALSSGKHDTCMSSPREHSFESQMSSPPLSWSLSTLLAPSYPKQHGGAVQPDTGESAHSVVEVSGTPSSLSSSTAFESNMDDIEQYLGQDLEGFERLSY